MNGHIFTMHFPAIAYPFNAAIGRLTPDGAYEEVRQLNVDPAYKTAASTDPE